MEDKFSLKPSYTGGPEVNFCLYFFLSFTVSCYLLSKLTESYVAPITSVSACQVEASKARGSQNDSETFLHPPLGGLEALIEAGIHISDLLLCVCQDVADFLLTMWSLGKCDMLCHLSTGYNVSKTANFWKDIHGPDRNKRK